MLETVQPPAAPIAIEELRSFLRIESGQADGELAAAIRVAGELCEAFIGAPLLLRTLRETLTLQGGWQRLSAAPVRAIEAVHAIAPDGSEQALPADAYAIDIDGAGQGWVRVTAGTESRRIAVRYAAGMASDWNGVAEPIRHGIVRLAGHLHAEPGTPVPAAVAALWRPWRRLKLAAGARA